MHEVSFGILSARARTKWLYSVSNRSDHRTRGQNKPGRLHPYVYFCRLLQYVNFVVFGIKHHFSNLWLEKIPLSYLLLLSNLTNDESEIFQWGLLISIVCCLPVCVKLFTFSELLNKQTKKNPEKFLKLCWKKFTWILAWPSCVAFHLLTEKVHGKAPYMTLMRHLKKCCYFLN